MCITRNLVAINWRGRETGNERIPDRLHPVSVGLDTVVEIMT